MARTRETISPILHTIVFDGNKTYFVLAPYLLICMEGSGGGGVGVAVVGESE